jgi:FKBP-type peptidyl-prolyl cis-trans isomerase
VRDGFTLDKLALTDEEVGAGMQQLQKTHTERMQAEQKVAADKNLADGEAFLKENATKEGVVTTESGLQYKIITAGEGPKPGAEDVVKVHYRGTLLDGTEFDSSYKRNEPVTFPVGGVIPGWVEALQLMPVGSKWELYIPSGLAYGPGGAGGQIGPNSTLKFEVELLSIEPKKEAAEGAKE